MGKALGAASELVVTFDDRHWELVVFAGRVEGIDVYFEMQRVRDGFRVFRPDCELITRLSTCQARCNQVAGPIYPAGAAWMDTSASHSSTAVRPCTT